MKLSPKTMIVAVRRLKARDRHLAASIAQLSVRNVAAPKLQEERVRVQAALQRFASR